MRGFSTQGAVLGAALFCSSCGNETQDKADSLLNFAGKHLIVSQSTWNGVRSLECRPSTAQVCSPSGCESQRAQTSVFTRLSPSTGLYERCDARGCDSYQATVTLSGAFASFVLPNNHSFARVTGQDGYYEVLSQLDTVIIYWGQCRRIPS